MNDEINIEPCEAIFEDLEISVHSAKIEVIHQLTKETLEKQTPFTGIWESVSTYNNVESKTIAGKVFMIFRNQGGDTDLALWLEIQIAAVAPSINEMAAIFCKLIQYLFGWMKDYNDKNEIKDKNGERFVVPAFLYSTEHFKPYFPD